MILSQTAAKQRFNINIMNILCDEDAPILKRFFSLYLTISGTQETWLMRAMENSI